MVVDGYPHRISSFDNCECHIYVGLTGGWVSAGVVMRKNDGRGLECEAAFDDFAGINRGAVYRAFPQYLIRNKSVFPI